LNGVLINTKDSDILLQIKHNEKKKLVTFLNPYSYLLARKNIELFENFQIKIDGIVLVKVLNMFHIGHFNRKSFDMTSLVPLVFNEVIENSSTIFFVGASKEVIGAAIGNIQKEFPLLKIIGFRNGYFYNENDRNDVLVDICQLNPDFVICGMGTPLQEQFLVDLRSQGWRGMGYTCGGFLHQVANKLQYYPRLINKYNLRWIYRMYDEPKLISRYLFDYPKFLIVFTYDFFRYKL